MSKKEKIKGKQIDLDLAEKILIEFRIRVQTTHNAIDLGAAEHYAAAKLLGEKAKEELKGFEEYLEDMIYEDDDESVKPNSKAAVAQEPPIG